MGEQRVFLENGVELPAVGRQMGDILAVEDDLALIRVLKPAQNPKGRRLAAAAGAQQCEKFIFTDI